VGAPVVSPLDQDVDTTGLMSTTDNWPAVNYCKYYYLSG